MRVLRVSLGKEVVFPVRFNGYELGGIDVEVEVPEGVTLEEAFAEVHRRLRALRKEQANAAFEDWSAHMAKAGARVRE